MYELPWMQQCECMITHKTPAPLPGVSAGTLALDRPNRGHLVHRTGTVHYHYHPTTTPFINQEPGGAPGSGTHLILKIQETPECPFKAVQER